jgi:hypothetical protein
MSSTSADKPASQQIDAIIEASTDWRGKMLAELRAVIMKADSEAIEEVKWKKPSRPSGVPVWSHDGIMCVGDILKNAVRLTFPKGAQINDPHKLFNARLDSKTVRAVDLYKDVSINETALRLIILEAAALNHS